MQTLQQIYSKNTKMASPAINQQPSVVNAHKHTQKHTHIQTHKTTLTKGR